MSADGASRKPFRGEGGPAPAGVNAVCMTPEGPRPAGAYVPTMPARRLRIRDLHVPAARRGVTACRCQREET